jgi:sucrose-6-phosphate hydrolase SacC (GH32 family)
VDIPANLSDIKLTIFYDRSTLEVFMNDGRWLMTDLVFPLQLFNKIKVNIPGNSGEMEHLKVERINSVW